MALGTKFDNVVFRMQMTFYTTFNALMCPIASQGNAREWYSQLSLALIMYVFLST